MLSWLNCPLSNKPMVGTPPAQDFAPAVEVSPDFEGDSACHPGGFKGIPWKIWKLYDLLTECMEIEISYSLPINQLYSYRFTNSLPYRYMVEEGVHVH